MPFEHYIRSGTKQLRCGYTTGTCAALAAAGAVQCLLTGAVPETLTLRTPSGLTVEVLPEECRMEGACAVCSVRKDAGDDPDVTDGILITAHARRTHTGIRLEGGEGVGRVTKPGLDQPVGEAAINTVPRRMIRAAVEGVCTEAGYGGGLHIVISAPEGRSLAARTFNPQLGIEGGISILGTSGIVEPMSEKALVDTIELEIRQARAEQADRLILTPGNYGLDFLKTHYPFFTSLPVVKCSNFIGDAIDIALTEGFGELLLVGHAGKLIKLAGGIMNTHSRVADCRRELFCAYAALCGADRSLCESLMNQVTTDGCLDVLGAAGLRDAVMARMLQEIQSVLDRRCAGAARVGAVLFTNEHGLLGVTAGAEKLLNTWKAGKESTV